MKNSRKTSFFLPFTFLLLGDWVARFFWLVENFWFLYVNEALDFYDEFRCVMRYSHKEFIWTFLGREDWIWKWNLRKSVKWCSVFKEFSWKILIFAPSWCFFKDFQRIFNVKISSVNGFLTISMNFSGFGKEYDQKFTIFVFLQDFFNPRILYIDRKPLESSL